MTRVSHSSRRKSSLTDWEYTQRRQKSTYPGTYYAFTSHLYVFDCKWASSELKHLRGGSFEYVAACCDVWSVQTFVFLWPEATN